METRKKVFIIHGKGVQNGLGRESGGDLDTIASNVFYTVWARNHLRETLGRDPVYGQDYVFDFVNYSEGLFHLVVHRGSDIYLPDFPIDALVPRIRMLVITEPKAIRYLNEFTRLFTEYRRWFADFATAVSPTLKAVSNEIFLQHAKVIEHQESDAIKTGNNIIYLFYNLAYLDVARQSPDAAQDAAAIAAVIDRTIQYTTGEKLRQLKSSLADLLMPRNELDLIDKVLEGSFEPADEKRWIRELNHAVDGGYSTKGRIGYTDELLITAVEAVAHIVRGVARAAALQPSRIDPKLAAKSASDIDTMRRLLGTYFSGLIALIEQTPAVTNAGVKSALDNLTTCIRSLIDVTERVGTPAPRTETDGTVPVRLMVMYEDSGIAVSNIEVVVRRVEGAGVFVLPDGSETSDDEVRQITDKNGAVELAYRPITPNEKYQFSATFDDLNHTFFPSDTNPNADTAPPFIEDAADGGAGRIHRAMKVSLDFIDRQIRFLNDHDIRIAAIDDHHPYTPAILDKLRQLHESGEIGPVNVWNLPRGQEQPVEEQKCGADLIYEKCIEGQPWDNAGLAKLRHLAHVQDLAIEKNDLAIQLSKLIGSRHGKIDMVLTLADTLLDTSSMDQVMSLTHWDDEVRRYEEKLANVLPRTEQIIGHIRMDGHVQDDGSRKCLHILAVLSPFCDPKKGEPQINVASAVNHLTIVRHHPADYFFFCYDSKLMTMRKLNRTDDSLDLSVLAQQIGTPADGGHSGAATCRPGQNPAMPPRIFSRIKDYNFLAYLTYLGEKIARAGGMELAEVRPPELEQTENQSQKLDRMIQNSVRMELSRDAADADKINILAVKPPSRAGDSPTTYMHVFLAARRMPDIHYLLHCPTGLNAVIIHNVNDPDRRLDPAAIARAIGWSEDCGTGTVGVATSRLNKHIPKKMRRLNDEDFLPFCRLLGNMIAACSDYKTVSVKPSKPA